MPCYLEIPEALDFVAGQSWLAPDEAVCVPTGQAVQRRTEPRRLSWREAARQIVAILGRIERP